MFLGIEWFDWIATLAKIGVVIGALQGLVAVMTWVERRVSGFIQFRLGPNRVGPFGLFQPVADGVKFIMKQDLMPANAHKAAYLAAPFLALVTSLLAFSVIPFGPEIEVLGRAIALQIVDVDGGVLLVLAATSLGVYGIVMAGWSSSSKYSLMGGLRSSAQMISYELALGLSIIGVLLSAGTLRPSEIVAKQGASGWFWDWNVFAGGWQLLGFAIFVIAVFAETNRLPFDLPEAESELVAGYHTEYSGMRFAMFFMAEYIAMGTGAAMAVTLFLGGYHLGFPVPFTGWPLWILQIGAFVGKMSFFLFLFVWVRWTLPRFRYDQLMDLGWKAMLPLSLGVIVLTAGVKAFVFAG